MLHSKKFGNIEITVDTKGAELKSLKNKNEEFMWNANPKYWGKTSPVLFPFVGSCKDGKYKYNGMEYSMGRHGFARDNEFELKEIGENNLTFSYKSNEKSLKIYPFNFEFLINYIIKDSGLEIEYQVINKEQGEIYFGLGTHPAFIADKYPIEDYYLEFSQEETLDLYVLEEAMYVSRNKKPYLNNEKIIKITENIFENDALIFNDVKSKYLSIKNIHDSKEVKVSLDGFPWLGIWSPVKAPFLCLEPWCGVADFINHDGNLINKDGINKLDKDEIFKKTMEIIVNN